MRPMAWRWLSGLFAGVMLLGVPAAARAQPNHGEEASANGAEAKKLFSRGSQLFLAKRYSEALVALRSSYNLVPSPNSGLLVARCLRELGQPVEAQDVFAAVEAEARRRVAAGSGKYARTAEAAASEGAAVRATLGSLVIHVDAVEAGTRLEVDGAPVTLSADGNATVWHAPGEATVSVRPASGMEQQQVATLSAGQELKMDFKLTPPAAASTTPTPFVSPPKGAEGPSPSPATPSRERPKTGEPAGGSWAKSAAWVAGGATVVGFGLFTGFGLASQSEYRDLSNRCGPNRCGPADQSEALAGERNQTIANVCLIVGSAAAAATITFIVIAATSSHSSTTTSGPAGAILKAAQIGFGGVPFE